MRQMQRMTRVGALVASSTVAVLAGSASAQTTAIDDVVARELGGLRGRLIGATSADVAKNGEGSTIRLKDGTLLHALSRHIRPKDVKAYANPDLWPSVVSTTTSRDGGGTWSEPIVLFRSTTGENAMQPSFARLANGDIGLTYSRIDSLSQATKVFRASRDEGRTWSDELVISPTGTYWTSAHDRMVVLSTGRIVHPLHTKLQVTPEKMATRVAYSDDHGRTWTLAPQVLDVTDTVPGFSEKFPGRTGFWETSIAERADGSLLMIGRTYGGFLYSTVSTDRGVTWSTPAPTTLMSSASPGRLERVPGTNDLLVVWNSCCLNPAAGNLGNRVTLSAAISSDGGTTWHDTRTIEAITPGQTNRVEYPAINIYDGLVYVTYRAQTGRDQQTMKMHEYLSVLPLNWFYAERDHHRPAAVNASASR